MADSGKEAIHCGPCEYENISKLAVKWCSDCEEGYCDECLRLHKAAKMSRHHHLVQVSEYQKFDQMAIQQICQVHRKTYEYFCPGHDSVICISCVQSEHSKCQDLLSLHDAAQGAKLSTAMNDLELNIDNIMDNIENGLKFQDKNLSSVLESERIIKIAIKAQHDNIIQYFERMLQKTLIELTAKHGHCQQEIASSKSTFLKTQTQLRNVKDRICQMKTCLSDVQTFVGMKLMTGSVNEQREEVKSLVTDMASLGLTFEPNLKIQTFIENIEAYGATTMTTSKHCDTFVETKVEQAQLNIKPVNTTEGIQLQLRTRINYEYTPSSISSCLILPDKQIMILDRKKNFLIIYNVNGTHDRDIAVHDKPYDATIIDRHTVAVTCRVEEIISIVDIKSNRIIRNIETAGIWYWGISYDNGKLYALAHEKGINVLDLSGCIIQTFPVDVQSVYKLVTSNQNIIYTNNKGNIYCLGSNGTQTCIYSSSNQKKSVSSITADEKGNIYTIYPQSNILIAISNDGKTKTVLLTEADGLKKPEAVNYNKEQKLLLICSGEYKHAELYDVRL